MSRETHAQWSERVARARYYELKGMGRSRLQKYLNIPERRATALSKVLRRLEADEESTDIGGTPPSDLSALPEAPETPSSTIEGDDHNIEVNVRGQALVMSLEDLIHISKLNTDEWRVVKHVANTWTTAMKNRVTVGKDDKGTPIIEDKPRIIRNWQVKAWCERRMDTNLRLPKFSKTLRRKPSAAPEGSSDLCLLIPDTQIGFRRNRSGRLEPIHDRRVLDLALQLAETLQPGTIIFLGDNVDLAEWSSKYPTPIDLIDTTEPSLAEFRWWLACFRTACPHAEIKVLEGNHDKRVRDRLIRMAPAGETLTAYGDDRPAMSLDRLLALDRLDVEWVAPYGSDVWMWDQVRVTHGDVVRGRSGATVTAEIRDCDYSKVFGHIHRVEHACRTKWTAHGPKVIFAASLGCACRLAEGIVPGFKVKQNWQQSVGLLSWDPSIKQESIEIAHVHKGRMFWRGGIMEAEDHTAAIGREVGWPMEHDWLREGE